MRMFEYRARFEPDDEGGIVVSFPDVPEAISPGDDWAGAYAQARETIGLALLTYPFRGLPLPLPEAKGKDLVAIPVDPGCVAKLAVWERFRAAGISRTELARLLGKDENKVRRILDPMHATKLSALAAALEAMGQRLVISVGTA